jgi:hypothetical protein
MFGQLCLVLSVGCVSAPQSTNLVDADIRYAETKALFEDKVKSDSHTASIDLFYQPNSIIRLEISALLGYPVGSLVMNSQQIAYAIHPQKVFVQGPFIPQTLNPLFKQDMDPRLLWAVVFDQDFQKFNFVCTTTLKQQSCFGVKNMTGFNITQDFVSVSKPDQLKKITIENDKFKFVWVFKSIRKHTKSHNETFVLKQPEKYRLITIK